MIEKIIYLFLVLFLAYGFFKLEKKLKKNYYSEYANSSFLFTSRIPLAIIYPFPFFEKKKFLRGYLLYLVSWLLIGLNLYFLFKLVGIIN